MLNPIIAAIASRDWSRIQPLLQRRDEPCLTRVVMESERPKCPEGAAEGTMIPVFPAAGCHNFVFEEGLEDRFAGPTLAPLVLHGIYRAGSVHPRVARLPAGEYGIIMDGGSAGELYTVSRGKVVSADFGCGLTASGFRALVPEGAFLAVR